MDARLLFRNNAIDEKSQQEYFKEKMEECLQYSRMMIAIDLDCLVGVNENSSDSSMGETMSCSIGKHQLWNEVVGYIQQFEASESYQWLVLLSSHNFITS